MRALIVDDERLARNELRRLLEQHLDVDYSRVHFGSNRPLVRSTLQALEQRLDPAVFFRGSRSQILNLRFVEAVEGGVDESLTVRMRTGQVAEVSRRQTRRLRESLSL